jgi:hypothetical protein
MMEISSALRAPSLAIASEARELRAFWVMEALISSSEEVVSSTLAACSPVPCERVCAVEDTWAEAPASASAPLRTSPRTCESRSSMSRMAAWSLPSSSLLETTTSSRRSPPAIRVATSTVARSGTAIPRVTTTASRRPRSAARAANPRRVARARV